MKVVFFFQAEDGIRDGTVTGVQTCALPICGETPRNRPRQHPKHLHKRPSHRVLNPLDQLQIAKPLWSAVALLPLSRLIPASRFNRKPSSSTNPPLPTFQDTPTMLNSSFRDPNQQRNPRIPAALTRSAHPLDRPDPLRALPLLFPQSRRPRPRRPRRTALRLDRPRHEGNRRLDHTAPLRHALV